MLSRRWFVVSVVAVVLLLLLQLLQLLLLLRLLQHVNATLRLLDATAHHPSQANRVAAKLQGWFAKPNPFWR